MEIIYGLNDLEKVASDVLKMTRNKVICLYGSMGVGKTTLVKDIIKILSSKDSGNSPSFGIVNEYRDEARNVVAYHFDFYRIDDPEEALDIGFFDYLDKDVHTFIEWPEKIDSFLPTPRSELHLDLVDEDKRTLFIKEIV